MPLSKARIVAGTKLPPPPSKTATRMRTRIKRSSSVESECAGRRGCPLPFYAAKAEAEPRDPDVDRDLERRPDAVARQEGGWNEIGQAIPSEERDDDPLEALLDWIHHQADAKVKVSIASDDDCLHLLGLLEPQQVALLGLRSAVRRAADRFARVCVNDAGAATVSILAAMQSPSLVLLLQQKSLCSHRWRKSASLLSIQRFFNSRADDGNVGQDVHALARRAVRELGKGHGPATSFAGLLSSRLSAMYHVGPGVVLTLHARR